MKLPAALLFSISVAAFAGTTSTADEVGSAEYTTTFAQGTTARRTADTTVGTPAPPRRKPPKPAPRYCPACGMG